MSRRQSRPRYSSSGLRRAAAALLLAHSPARATLASASDGAPPASSIAPSPAAPATPTPNAPLSVWYRSSEGCPEGTAFILRLAELGRPAKLASVGDPVDFVVTLASTANASSGRLERQTARGTVAIRELGAPRCEEVAEALALSLELALAPASEAPGSAPTADPERATTEAIRTEASGIAPPPPLEVGTIGDPGTRPSTPNPPESSSLRLGVQASLMSGLAPSWALGGGVFAELRVAPDLELRATLEAALQRHDLGPVDLDVTWFATRLEGCPFDHEFGRFSLQPCVGTDVGLLQATSRLGLSTADADDATQQVFMVAARRRDELVAGKERSFLYGTAMRVAANLRRGLSRRREVPSHLHADPRVETVLPDELLERRQACERLDALLAQLPEELARVLVLAEVEHLTTAAIAELEAIPTGTAASRLRRARARFRELLEEQQVESGRQPQRQGCGSGPCAPFCHAVAPAPAAHGQ